MIQARRVYEPAATDDGIRVLVERLWPRGLRKDAFKMDEWLKDVAPSTELRRWFSHDPARWDEFRRRYFEELDAHRAVWEPLVEAARRGTLTLLYSSHDTQHNNAVALREYLDAQLNEL